MPFFPQDSSYDGDLVTVARRYDPIAAELVRGRLAADGIPATLGDAHLVQTSALWANALGGVRVMVPAAYAAQALRAIAAIEGGDLRLEDEDDDEEADPEARARCDPPARPGTPPPRPARPPHPAVAVAALLVLFAVLELLGRLSPALH